ncbi:hypothetical protein [Benzoatithermus flavus]|uniref:hypothetical protein n=1 Tax=Benzoatithermus flavus TaxID=3108223 RepID=UPI003AAD0D15
MSARITLDGACRLSGSLTFDGVRFSVVGRTDSDVHLFNGVAISPAGNFGISGSHL